MKKDIRITRLLGYMLVACLLLKSMPVFAAESSVEFMSDDEILLLTGMPQEEINNLDVDVKTFIINDLKESGELFDIEYFSTEEISAPTPRTNQVLSDISFSVSSFKSNNTVYVYPTYEFTADKKPAGKDSFSFQFGDALMPYEYGGQVWYKDYTMSDWKLGGSMTANGQGFNGAEYSGAQLGSPDWSMKMKGCAYAHAQIGSGTDKRIIMSYMHNPNGKSYSITFSYGAVGITYNSSDTIYTAAQTNFLSY